MDQDTYGVAAAAALTPELRDNAHRIYDYLLGCGLQDDSLSREGAFHYASSELGLPYDAFYDAWLNDRPLRH